MEGSAGCGRCRCGWFGNRCAKNGRFSPIGTGHRFYRYNPAEFANFLRCARASVAEALTRLPDGVKRGYYEQSDIDTLMATRAAVIGGLRESMRRLAKQRKAKNT